MPTFKNVMAGLAVSTALVGGAITLGATSASASGPWDMDRNKNEFFNEDFTNLTVGAGKAFVNFNEFDKKCHRFHDERNHWDR
ncbi:hypothetical protein Pth03_53960 [Planotetraspora thailandica]|uniref:Uncharacterized protein n=1 Tax=Planotetraspora thailandica TaxID=487172 RepID=A0A8J3XVX7_9ACTN|nr:hypothetical protein [Planotetraspora thailandica]GII57007.1 hypothetical protein Pth03_53960 [Planotetraspora thailandica]